MTAPRRPALRALDLIAAVLCLAVLLGTVGVVVLASARVDAAPAPTLDTSGMLDPGTTSDTGLRALPLLQPDGPVAAAFPDGVDDPLAVRTLADSIGKPLDLDYVMSYLLKRHVKPIDDAHVLDLYDGYPYAYEGIDDQIAYWLDADAVRRDPATVVELAGLLILSSVETATDASAFNGKPDLPIAYSLLRHARAINETCDIQLQLTFAVAMGFAPHIGDLEGEVNRARDDCPGDPTPLWLLGQVQTVQANRGPKFFDDELGPNAMEAEADATFATLRHEFPDSPLGWAGAADLRLKQADEGDALGIERFSNRIRRRQALALSVHARTLSDDPALLVGYGRALSGLGRDDEAVAALTQAHEAFPDDAAVQAVLVQALQRAGRPQDVVDLLEPRLAATDAGFTTLRLTPQTYATHEPELTAYGAIGSRAGAGFDMTQKYSAGSTASDLGFLQDSNGTWTDLWCPQENLVGAQTQVGDGAAAWAAFQAGEQITPAACTFGDPVGVIAEVAALASDDATAHAQALHRLEKSEGDDVTARSIGWEHLQDFWRSVHDWDRARDAVAAWAEDLPADPWAPCRRGEIAFLTGDDDAAISAFTEADAAFLAAAGAGWGDHGYADDYVDEEVGAGLDQLQLGASLERAGHLGDAAAAYEQAAQDAQRIDSETGGSTDIGFYAESQLGGMSLAAGDLDAAVEHYDAALARYYDYEDIPKPGHDFYVDANLGAQDNNLALALAEQGKDIKALAHAEAALAHDGANPVYVDTVAFVQQLGGHDQDAIATYESVLALDPSAYVSANNLAVLLGQHGQTDEAIGLLEKALTVAPSYALGWHNLGVLREPTSGDLLSSQGALAHAASLDRGFRGEDGLQVDRTIYSSGLDVSKPLSPDWRYADTATRTRLALTWGALALLLLRLLWLLGLDKVTGWISERVIKASDGQGESGRRGISRWFWRRLGGPVAVVASIAVLGWPVLTAAHSSLERATLVGAVTAMVLLPLVVRRLAVPDAGIRHYAWVPALAVGAVGVPFGLAFAPYPTLDAPPPPSEGPAPARETRLRWLVPAVVAPVALVFIALAALDPVPMARVLAVTATALLASVLTPIPPLDGAYLQHRLLGIGVTVVFTLTTIAFALKWI